MANPDMESRKDAIFGLIVRSYIDTAEPVGSRTISRLFKLGLSPASIRNVMADLEDQGLIAQPHTSAGRVPTDKGYRYYVDRLMEPETLSDDEKDWISSELGKSRTIEGLAEKVSKVISELTDNVALIYIRNLKRVSFLNHLLEELVNMQRLNDFFEEEEELFIEGVFRVFEQPEFQAADKMRKLLQMFDEKDELIAILYQDFNFQGVQVHIGSESPVGDRNDVSMVVKDCYVGQTPIGGVAVVGPTRMKYQKVMPIVEFVADGITQRVQGF